MFKQIAAVAAAGVLLTSCGNSAAAQAETKTTYEYVMADFGISPENAERAAEVACETAGKSDLTIRFFIADLEGKGGKAAEVLPYVIGLGVRAYCPEQVGAFDFYLGSNSR